MLIISSSVTYFFSKYSQRYEILIDSNIRTYLPHTTPLLQSGVIKYLPHHSPGEILRVYVDAYWSWIIIKFAVVKLIDAGDTVLIFFEIARSVRVQMRVVDTNGGGGDGTYK